jgi:hypothetical protein
MTLDMNVSEMAGIEPKRTASSSSPRATKKRMASSTCGSEAGVIFL